MTTTRDTHAAPTVRRREDGRFVAVLVRDDGATVEIELSPTVTTIEEARRAVADLRRVTPRAPRSR
jgi:hypothetical protein